MGISQTYGSGGGSPIKSIQHVSIQATNGNLTANLTVASVNTALTAVQVFAGIDTTGTINLVGTCELTSATNLRFTRGASSGASSVHYVTLIEYNPGILKSLNTYDTTVSTNVEQSHTQTITAVVTTKSEIVNCGARETSSTSNGFTGAYGYSLDNSTQLTAYAFSTVAAGAILTKTQVVEFL